MKTLSKTAARTFNALIAGMEPGDHRRIDNTDGAYMAVVVEFLTEDRVSIAHYYEQNGDLCADPDVEFWRGATGEWMAVAITQAWCGYSAPVRFGADGQPTHVAPRQQRDLATFANQWMANIKRQQGRISPHTKVAPAPAATPVPNSCEMRQMDLF